MTLPVPSSGRRVQAALFFAFFPTGAASRESSASTSPERVAEMSALRTSVSSSLDRTAMPARSESKSGLKPIRGTRT